MVKELNQKTTNRNLLTVDQYIQKYDITDAEFNLRVYSGEIHIFASVNSLPIVHYQNIARIEVSPSEFWKTKYPDEAMYVYLNDHRPGKRKLVKAHGLIGLSRSAIYQILTNGSVQLKINSEVPDQEVYISKYTFKSTFENPELAFPRRIHGVIPTPFEIRQTWLFPDRVLEKVVLEYDPEFSLDEWESSKIYRESKFDFLTDLFNSMKKKENEYNISSLREIRVLIPEIFQESGVLGDLVDKPASEYIASYSQEVTGRKKYLKDKEIGIAIKLPAPIITKEQLVINESDEDMYELNPSDSVTETEDFLDNNNATEDFESTEGEILFNLAKREFWSTYDPDDPSTIPLKKEITEWLKTEHGASNQLAESIDLILRGGRSRPGRKPIG